MSEPFQFLPEPGDDKIPDRWAKNPPWKADPDLGDLVEIMEPLERDYWAEGGQSLAERQEFLARIEARWRRWKDVVWQRSGRKPERPGIDLSGMARKILEDAAKTESKQSERAESPKPPHTFTRASLQALEGEVDRSTKVMAEAAEILRQRNPKQPQPLDHQPHLGTDLAQGSHQRAIVASAIASSLVAIAMNVLNQKYGTLVPDWLILLLVYSAISFWLYALWHTKRVRQVRLLLYTSYPLMFLIVLIAAGAVVGAAAGAGLWVVNRNEQRVKAASNDRAHSTTSETTPTSAPVKLPSMTPSPPSEVDALSGSSYFNRFLGEPRQLHKSFKTYSVLTRAEGKPRPYYVRLGAMDNGDVRYVLYVPRIYYLPDVLIEVMTHHEQIGQDLKAEMKKDGTEVLGLAVSKWIIAYVDAGPNEGVNMADVNKTAKAIGFQYIVERKIY